MPPKRGSDQAYNRLDWWQGQTPWTEVLEYVESYEDSWLDLADKDAMSNFTVQVTDKDAMSNSTVQATPLNGTYTWGFIKWRPVRGGVGGELKSAISRHVAPPGPLAGGEDQSGGPVDGRSGSSHRRRGLQQVECHRGSLQRR